MTDIKLNWDDFTTSLPILKGDFTKESGLATAVIISLFSNARADELDLPADEDLRGYWGDGISDHEGDKFGSKIWLLFREAITSETLLKLKEYARESLNWMIEDKVASRIDIEVERDEMERIDMMIVVYRGDEKAIDLQFQDIWKNIG